ncbi:MAG: hypothetical protein M1818_007015 [Claussenomyces sp. TS43310]|nr:MAG: hypothetical protein M1818_007015 [Claussenomyces sp. TS43310]
MPKAAPKTSGPQSAARFTPYLANTPDSLKENYCPAHAAQHMAADSASRTAQPLHPKSPNVQDKPPSKTAKSNPDKSAPQPRCSTSNNGKPASFLDRELEGEETDSVRIFDNCATLRRKIKNLLGKDKNSLKNAVPGQTTKDGNPKPYTQAQLCKDMGGISPSSLNTFLNKKGTMSGGTSNVYPAAYAFFEKKRIFEGAKKSKTREEFESE